LRNAREIHEEPELPGTIRQVRGVFHNTQSVQWMKMKSKPQLTPEHKNARMNFSKDYTWTEEWKRVIFSDEKNVNLDGLDCYSNYWNN
jgi:hypothetical protein